jgi:hypothetical protein
VRRLSFATDAASRPAPALLLSWLAMAAAALLLPWALFPGVLSGADAALKALWPVLAGAALLPLLARLAPRLPEPPPGDILVLAGPLRGVAARVANVLARAEAALRAWPAAGLALLAVMLALGLALGAG